jgi:hypothetical protein
MSAQLKDFLYKIDNKGFENVAMDLFYYQINHVPDYAQWVHQLNKPLPHNLASIPFLPITFFKTKSLYNAQYKYSKVFESSGTTGSINSKHYVVDELFYEQNCLHTFENVYGSIKDWCILGLLPHYLEKGNSSLVHMVDYFIKQSSHINSGFYLNDFNSLAALLNKLEQQNQKVWLIGVTYALIDFFKLHALPLKNTVVVETGGMKGRKREMLRQEIHNYLKLQTGLKQIHAEYGMTELFSQAYKTNGAFKPAKTMKVLVRSETDPLNVNTVGRGLLNIVDLANQNSISFIATDDYGEIFDDGSFEVLGRVDNSDVRGCSLMYDQI